MKNKYLETGKIVGTHGVKGMARVQLWADSQDFLSKFKRVYTDKNGENKLEILKAQAHKNVCLVAFKGINTIEEIEKSKLNIAIHTANTYFTGIDSFQPAV